MLRGAQSIISLCEEKLGISIGQTTKDGKFTIIEVECLGACVDAPVIQINNDYYENMDAKKVKKIIDEIKNL